MNNLQITLINNLLTRNIEKDISQFKEFDRIFTEALTPDQREFFSANFKSLPLFFKSDKGKASIQKMADDWMDFATTPDQKV